MTYTTQNTAVAVATGDGFNECLYERANVAVLVRTVGGTFSVPTRMFGQGISDRTCSGWAQRVQSTFLEFDAQAEQMPVVRFGGACSRPYIRNESIGREFFVRAELLAGEELTVDMHNRRVTVDGTMVFGWTGRWFAVKPGDQIRAGASGIGAGFYAEVDVVTVGGLVVKPVFGMGASERAALGRPQVDVARVGAGASERAGSAGRNGVGVGRSPRVASGTAVKKRDYA